MSSRQKAPTEKQRKVRQRKYLPPGAPLLARKMFALFTYLGWPSDPRFGESIGASHDEVGRWRCGKTKLKKKDRLVIAHVYDVPVDWWETRDEAVADAIARWQRGKLTRWQAEHASTVAAPSQKGGETSDDTVIHMPHYGPRSSWEKIVDAIERRERRLLRADAHEAEPDGFDEHL